MGSRRDGRMVRLERVAAKQDGVVGIEQLYRIGFSFSEIRGLIDQGHLHPIHRGVYAVGHRRLSRRGWLFAAVLAAGDGSFLSHRTAAGLRGLRGIDTWNIEVTRVGRHTRKRSGLTIHRLKCAPPPSEVTTVDGLRVASVPLILVQIAPTSSHHELVRMIELAVRRGSLRMDDMEAALQRHYGERGLAKLKQALKDYRAKPFDKSGLERSVAAAIARDPRIPVPERNVYRTVGGIRWELDFWWERERVALEVDGGQYHLTPADREKDRLKDAKLMADGIVPMRITDVRWELEPREAMADLSRIISARET